MRHPIKGFLAAAAVGVALMAARPSAAQDTRWSGSSNWRHSGEHRFRSDFRDRGFRDRDLRFHHRDGRLWRGHGFVAPYYDYDDYVAPYGYYGAYAAPVYPYYRPRVVIQLPFPRFRLHFPRFHHRFGW